MPCYVPDSLADDHQRLGHLQAPGSTSQVGRCMLFANIRTALAPSVDALVNCEASLSACSRDFRGGPLMVKTRCRPEWLLPPCGMVICACQTVSFPPTASRSTTSA
mmetsp:Transcript_21230/g.41532  ORF Transcript_21230/g.41532 Transcript_21230/m.41532 type:complete len:106 (+) Transcript_21230:83-400(+)